MSTKTSSPSPVPDAPTSSAPPTSFVKQHGQKLIAALFWVLLIAAYIIYTARSGLSPLGVLRQLVAFLSDSIWGPLIFIGIYVLRPLILFSAGLLTIASGVLFGPFWGVVYTVIGSNLGASLAYFIGRFFGAGTLKPEAGGVFAATSGISKYVKRMQENSFETVFIMRLIFLPYDLVNYLAGFLKINYGAFILASILGALPGTISFALFGASSGLSEGAPSFDWRILAASVGIFVLSLVISRLVKRREGVA